MMKRGFEFSFTWIFVLVVGAAILVLAIFLVARLVDREGAIYNTEVAAELGAALNPAGTILESAKYYPLSLPAETRISNDCDASSTFGEQEISTQVKSGVGREWRLNGIPYRVSNHFIFSAPDLETQELHIVSAPVTLPYKVGDAITLYAGKLCFVNPPDSFKDEIMGLGAESMIQVSSRNECPEGSMRICFEGSGCEVMVQSSSTPHQGSLNKKGATFYYGEGLFYAALVSDSQLYTCQLARIRKRASELASLYAEKNAFLEARGCSSSITSALSMYRQELLNPGVSFTSLLNEAEVLSESNDRLACKIF